MIHHSVVSSILLLGVAAVVMISSMVTAMPAETDAPYRFYGCTKPSDCGPGECCVIGMMRYSIPTCRALGKEGDSCRNQDQTRNMSLTYPNGVTLNVENSYTLICPCDAHYGLSCTQGTCQTSVDYKITNAV